MNLGRIRDFFKKIGKIIKKAIGKGDIPKPPKKPPKIKKIKIPKTGIGKALYKQLKELAEKLRKLKDDIKKIKDELKKVNTEVPGAVPYDEIPGAIHRRRELLKELRRLRRQKKRLEEEMADVYKDLLKAEATLP